MSRKPSWRSWSVRSACGLALAQKRRQPQQPVAPRLTCPARHRAAGFRRNVDQVRGLPGHRAIFQRQPETELAEHRQLEMDHVHGRAADVVEIVERMLEPRKDFLVRIALRKEPRNRGQMGDAVNAVGGCQQRRGAQLQTLDRVGAEMLVEPRPPYRADAVAGLQQRAASANRRRRARGRDGGRARASSSSTMALLSPCRRTPSTMPSSVHSMEAQV